MPPVMIADTAIAHSPRSRPKRGPNAAPASTMRKKIPLPPPGSPSRRSSPALAARTPRIATDAPVIVPRRTSIAIAATTSPPTTAATRGASPAWAAFGQRGSREPERVEEGARADDDREQVDQDGPGAGAPRWTRTRPPSCPLHRAGQLLDREEGREDSHDLGREQRSGEHVARRAGRDGLSVTEDERVRGATGRELHVMGREDDRAAATRVLGDRTLERVRASRRPCPASARRAGGPRRRRPRPRRSRPAAAGRRTGCAGAGRRARRGPSASNHRSTAASFGRPRRRSVSFTSARTVAANSIAFGSCGTYAVVGRGSTRPASGARSPPRIRSSVLLPGPVAAEQRDDLAPPDLDVDAVQHRAPVERDADALGAQEDLTRHRGGGGGRRVGAAGGSGRSVIATARPRAGAHRQRRRVPAEQAAEPGHARCARVVGEHRARRRGRDGEPPAVEEDRSVRERRGALEPVLGEQHRRPEVGVEAADRGEHVLRALRVELRGRLVEDERVRRGREGARDRGALALAPGERRPGCGRAGGRCRARRAPPRPAAASRRRAGRGSRGRTRRRPRPGRRRTAPRGPGARTRRRRRARGACGCAWNARTRRRRRRTARRSSAGRGRSRRAAACSSPSPTNRRRGGSRPRARRGPRHRARAGRPGSRTTRRSTRWRSWAVTGSGSSSGSGRSIPARLAAVGGRGVRLSGKSSGTSASATSGENVGQCSGLVCQTSELSPNSPQRPTMQRRRNRAATITQSAGAMRRWR